VTSLGAREQHGAAVVTPTDAGERAASPARTIFLAFVASRLVVLAAALVAENLAVRNPRLTSGDASPILRSLTSWDGWWYLGIARDGYHVAPQAAAYHDYVFPPLFPALLRVVSAPVPGLVGLLSVLLANGLFLVGLFLLYRLTCRVLDPERAVRSCVLLCLFPFSAVFSMAYTESLFLALMVGSLLAAERGRAPRSAILAALAGATRLVGVLLVLPLGLILWQRLADRRRLLWLAVVPLGALLFALYVAGLTGHLTGWVEAQSAWGRTGLAPGPADGDAIASAKPLGVALVLTLFCYVFLFVFFRTDRIPIAYALLAAVFLAVPALSGTLDSIGRYGMIAFPFVWALAGRRSRAMRYGWPVVSVVLLGAFSLLFFSGWYFP
jgi:hypothetical protein